MESAIVTIVAMTPSPEYLFLASDRACAINGAALPVYGNS
jgi:hypothetical protein